MYYPMTPIIFPKFSGVVVISKLSSSEEKSSASNSIINSIKENKQIFSEYFELREINEKLIIENTFLKNLKSISPDNKILYKNIDTNYFFYSGRIISNSIKFSKNFITINKGSNDKVSIDDGVISENGLIGFILLYVCFIFGAILQ